MENLNKSMVMQEMSLQEMQGTNGGVVPVIMWMIGAVILGVGVTNAANDSKNKE